MATRLAPPAAPQGPPPRPAGDGSPTRARPRPLSGLIGVFAEGGRQLAFYLRIVGDIVSGKVIRRRYASMVFALMSDIAIGAGALIVGGGMIFVIFSMSFFTGTEVGQAIGAQAFTGLIGAFANTREITPLIAGVAFAAQVGAGFTAELGAMRISDEIDALEVMSVNSVVYLVCTRVIAAALCVIPLYLLSLIASFFATEIVTTRFFGLSPGVYHHYFRLYLPPIDIFYSVCKATLFAVVVSMIHCYYGFTAKGGPAGVGVAVGRAIRASIVTVVILNLILSILFWGGGNTVKIAG
jgi:phospholipid/cholesterol/gamma-HCH transport system permease protein